MNYMKFNEGGGLEAMLKQAMMKKQGGEQGEKEQTKKERPMLMTGQYTSPVQQDEPTGREYVLYEHPNGQDTIKVYGNWNEYSASRDEQGRDMIADDDYPIYMNEEGDYVLDERAFELGEGMDQYKRPDMSGDPQKYYGGGNVKRYGAGGNMDSSRRLQMLLGKMRNR